MPRPRGLTCDLGTCCQDVTQDPPVRLGEQPDQFGEGLRARCTGLAEHLGEVGGKGLLALGEGVEKEESDFAAEVAAAAKG